MPVVINRSDTGGSGTPKKSGSKPAKKAVKKVDAVSPLDNPTVKIVLLSLVIIVSMAFLGWYLGLFGGSKPPAPNDSTVTTVPQRSPAFGAPGAPAAPAPVMPRAGYGASLPRSGGPSSLPSGPASGENGGEGGETGGEQGIR